MKMVVSVLILTSLVQAVPVIPNLSLNIVEVVEIKKTETNYHSLRLRILKSEKIEEKPNFTTRYQGEVIEVVTFEQRDEYEVGEILSVKISYRGDERGGRFVAFQFEKIPLLSVREARRNFEKYQNKLVRVKGKVRRSNFFLSLVKKLLKQPEDLFIIGEKESLLLFGEKKWKEGKEVEIVGRLEEIKGRRGIRELVGREEEVFPD
jgi:hypothetical protein